MSALAHDPVAWRGTKPEEYANQLTQEAANIKSPTVRQRALDDINRELDSVHKQGSTSDKPVHKTQLEFMKQSFEEASSWQEKAIKAVDAMTDEDFAAKYPEAANRAEVLVNSKNAVESERMRYAKAQKEYLDWAHSEKGENASPQEAADERERLGFGRYTTKDDVVASYKAGKIDRATAKDILRRQFGIQ